MKDQFLFSKVRDLYQILIFPSGQRDILKSQCIFIHISRGSYTTIYGHPPLWRRVAVWFSFLSKWKTCLLNFVTFCFFSFSFSAARRKENSTEPTRVLQTRDRRCPKGSWVFCAGGDTMPSKDGNSNTHCSPRAISSPAACGHWLGEASEPSVAMGLDHGH